MKRIIFLFLFALSFAYIEASVVVYLRDILYPEGFAFPLRYISPHRAIIEIGREFFSLILLLSVASLSSKDLWKRFGAFCFIFGVWDIFFYIWLKIFLDWPSSLLEWDILFLIPAPWTGPVIAPIIVSLTLILIFVVIELYKEKPFRITLIQAVIAILGFLSIFISFMWNATLTSKGGIPKEYPWYYLILGEVILLSLIINKVIKLMRQRKFEKYEVK